MTMALLMSIERRAYADGRMRPTAGDGPWGEAIIYWLKKRGWSQADLGRAASAIAKKDQATNLKNTVSNACLGRDCHTRTLRLLAAALNVPLDQLLVSPERKSDNERMRAVAVDIAERVLRQMEASGAPVAPAPPPAVAEPPLVERQKRRHRKRS